VSGPNRVWGSASSYHGGQGGRPGGVVTPSTGVAGSGVVIRGDELDPRHKGEAGVARVSSLAQEGGGRLRREWIVEVVESHW